MDASRPSIPLRAPTSLVAFALLLAVAFTLSFTPLRASHDEWWHLKSGQWIVEHGLPEKDVFTYSAESYDWHNHEWLTQIVMWRIYEWGEIRALGGVRCVIAFKALCILAAFGGMAVFLARRTGVPAAAAFACALACGLSRRTFYPRPPFVTYALLALVLCLLIAWRDRRLKSPWLLSLPPIFALWANLHGGFMAGLVVGGAFWLEALAAWPLAKWRMEPTRPPALRFGWITLAGILSAAATLATPYGIHLYELAERVMSDTRLSGIIGELLPPSWSHVWIFDAVAVLLLFAAVRPRTLKGLVAAIVLANAGLFAVRTAPIFFEDAVGARGIEAWLHEIFFLAAMLGAAARSKEKSGLALPLLAAFFGHQGAQHVRHLPLLAIMLAPILAEALAEWARGAARAWDAAWASGAARSVAPEAVAAAERRSLNLAQAASLAGAAWLAAFYLFWPGEAAIFADPEAHGVKRSDAFKAASFIDRNLRLIRGQEMEAGEYPVAAVDHLIATRPAGRLFNGGNYAGYLMWRLSPEKHKVFTDNRYDIWGGDFIEEELAALGASEKERDPSRPDWREVLKKWDARILFIPLDSPLHHRLKDGADAEARAWRLDWPNAASPPGEKFAIWLKSAADAPANPL